MTEHLPTLLALAATAFVAGIVNTLAGGGTLLTFPALVAALAGVPDATKIANMTSTVALVPGSLAGAWGFRRELAGNARWLLLLAPTSLIGGIIGSLLLALLPDTYFRRAIPWLLLLATLLFLAQGQIARFIAAQPGDDRPPTRAFQVAIILFQFLVSIYGGYFGAGIGILMLSSLGLMGIHDVHRMNAVKNLLVVCINGISAIVFVLGGQVAWRFAGVMAVAAIAGGFTGAHLGRRLPRAVVRGFIIVVGFGLTAWFFQKYYLAPGG